MTSAGAAKKSRLAKSVTIMLGQRGFEAMIFAARDEGKRPMRILAYILAIICAIAAVMYYTMQAGDLPNWMPGYMAGSTHIHQLHAYAAAVAAVVLFGLGWFAGRR